MTKTEPNQKLILIWMYEIIHLQNSTTKNHKHINLSVDLEERKDFLFRTVSNIGRP